MARPNIIRAIAERRGIEPDEWVLDTLNSHETLSEAADKIGVSPQALSEYSRNRFEKVCHWRRVAPYVNGTFTTVVSTRPVSDAEGQAQP